jgi:Clostridial hydrophobic W
MFPINRRLGYAVHIEQVGWRQGWLYDGVAAGTVGLGRRIECVRISGLPPDSRYRAHVRDLGWLPWVPDGHDAGTTGQARQLEALQIDVPAGFQLFGRAHVTQLGWMNLVRLGGGEAGSVVGTTGRGLWMEALQLWIVTPLDSLFDEVRALGDATPTLAEFLREEQAADPHSQEPAENRIGALMNAVGCLSALGALAVCAQTRGVACASAYGSAVVACTETVNGIVSFVRDFPNGGGANDRSPGYRDNPGGAVLREGEIDLYTHFA